MKKMLVIAVIAMFTFGACKQKTEVKVAETETIVNNEVKEDIVEGYQSDKNGERLDFAFDNVNNTGIFHFQGETIETIRDTTASGIRYSNSTFEYEEWQGHATLKKDGIVVFDNQQ